MSDWNELSSIAGIWCRFVTTPRKWPAHLFAKFCGRCEPPDTKSNIDSTACDWPSSCSVRRYIKVSGLSSYWPENRTQDIHGCTVCWLTMYPKVKAFGRVGDQLFRWSPPNIVFSSWNVFVPEEDKIKGRARWEERDANLVKNQI